MSNNINVYVCRRIRLFEALTNAGFVPFGTRPDRNNSKYMVWLFLDSPELRKEIEKFYSKL